MKGINVPEYMDVDGSRTLANMIGKHWAKLGYRVNTRIEACGANKKETLFCVRSDMVNGLPVRKLLVRVV